jgi:hypothetical protein
VTGIKRRGDWGRQIGRQIGWRREGSPVLSNFVRTFACEVCGARVAFENTACLTCGSALGFSLSARRVVVLRSVTRVGTGPAREYQLGAGTPVERPCANEQVAGCNWLAAEGDAGGLCLSCRLTRTRPSDSDEAGLAAFVRAEAAKRRLVYQLLDLGLPVLPWMDDREHGLAVDLLSSRDRSVVTGHANGVITLDLAEGDDPHREAVRIKLNEAYRTLLGHLRHESGHYYWDQLVGTPEKVHDFRELFGDERASYSDAIARHYDQGPPPGWESDYVSAYATMHPWEDWAETFAHYLHLRDLLQTANSYGLAVRRRVGDGQAAGVPAGGLDTLDDLDTVGAEQGVGALVDRWLPLSYALNAVNRSLGKDDLYPFVLTPPVIAKLDAVHAAINSAVNRVVGAVVEAAPAVSPEASPAAAAGGRPAAD